MTSSWLHFLRHSSIALDVPQPPPEPKRERQCQPQPNVADIPFFSSTRNRLCSTLSSLQHEDDVESWQQIKWENIEQLVQHQQQQSSAEAHQSYSSEVDFASDSYIKFIENWKQKNSTRVARTVRVRLDGVFESMPGSKRKRRKAVLKLLLMLSPILAFPWLICLVLRDAHAENKRSSKRRNGARKRNASS